MRAQTMCNAKKKWEKNFKNSRGKIQTSFPGLSRELIALLSREYFALAILFRMTHDGLSERGTTLSLVKAQCEYYYS